MIAWLEAKKTFKVNSLQLLDKKVQYVRTPYDPFTFVVLKSRLAQKESGLQNHVFIYLLFVCILCETFYVSESFSVRSRPIVVIEREPGEAGSEYVVDGWMVGTRGHKVNE